MRVAMLALVTVLLFGSAGSAQAGGEKGDWELGVYGGYGWLDDYGGLQPKDNALFGGRLGYFFSRHWSVELSGQQLPTERDTIGGANTEIKFGAYRGNLLYNFCAGKSFRPFLTAGVGTERIKVEGFDTQSETGWNAGAGLRFFAGEHFCVRADGRYVWAHIKDLDERESDIEGTLGLSVLFGGKEHETEAAEAPRPANQPPSVSCAADRPEILPGESVRITATAADPDGDPLSYEWSTSAGHVQGTGASVALDLAGVTAPASVTVTSHVSDGHGHDVSCEAAVHLVEPQKPAESVSCLAGGFPRNLSRLTNVDKACLDDVAQRLKADPRARVVVIGHADARETSPDRVGDQRAGAVKDYLVQAGIEASRITTRSSGSTHPLDTGTDAGALARNRRVEVWFVPEGAKDPD